MNTMVLLLHGIKYYYIMYNDDYNIRMIHMILPA